MAKLFDEPFNTDGEEELEDFTPVPAGTYTAIIKKSEMKENSAKTGSFLSLQFEITEGEHKGRLLFTNLNLDHPNEKAVQIARKTLTSITKACGLVTVEDSEELHGIEMEVKVQVKPASANYAESNELKGFYPLGGAKKPSKPDSSGKSGEPKQKQKVKF